MASDRTSTLKEINSMLKDFLEAQQREMAWDPTSHQDFESSSTYQEESFPNGYSSQEYQYGYGDGYQSWSMEHEYEATYSPQEDQTAEPTIEIEELKDMMKLLLEIQEESKESFKTWSENFDASFQNAKFAEPTYEENAQTRVELTQWIEEEEEEEGNVEEHFEDHCEDSLSVEEQESLIGEAPEGDEEEEKSAEEIVKEFEKLMGCTIGEDLVIRYEEENNQENDDNKTIVGHSTEIFKEIEEEESPMTQHLNKHSGIISTTSPSYQGPRKTPFEKFGMNEFRVRHCDAPKKIPFEEIRMNEFRGWFYDEYDPGDPNSTRTPT